MRPGASVSQWDKVVFFEAGKREASMKELKSVFWLSAGMTHGEG